jgi:hypothetical protein
MAAQDYWTRSDAPAPPPRRRRPVVLVAGVVAGVVVGAVGGAAWGVNHPTEQAVRAYVVDAMAGAVAGAGGAPAGALTPGVDTSTPAPPTTYVLKLAGSAKSASITWSYGGSSGSITAAPPWQKTVTIQPGTLNTVNVSGVTEIGATGDLTCTITDTSTNQVVATQTAKSDGGDSGYASVTCYK